VVSSTLAFSPMMASQIDLVSFSFLPHAMPRTDAANHVRTAPFVVGPWRTTTRKKKRKNEEEGECGEGDVDVDASLTKATLPTPTSFVVAPPPLAPKQQQPDDFDSAWEEELEAEGDAEDKKEPPKTLSGRGYLAFFSPSSSPSSSNQPLLRAVSGHFVDAGSMTAIGVSGLEIDPSSSGDLGVDVPPADACSFAAGDRMLALALFMEGGGGARRRGRGTTARSKPCAVVLALASGGDAATVEAPAPDPRGQSARRLLQAVAARQGGGGGAKGGGNDATSSSSPSVLAPPRGIRPPRVSFECGTLLAGRDAAAYLRGLGVTLPSSGSDEEELVVNVGTFGAVGVFESRKTDEGDDDENDGENDGDGEEQQNAKEETPVVFSEPAKLLPSDPGYDPDFDS